MNWRTVLFWLAISAVLALLALLMVTTYGVCCAGMECGVPEVGCGL